MTQNDKDLKELLLKDLCGRLPYGVKLQLYNGELDNDILNSIDAEEYIIINGKDDIETVKPYLIPLSSMTEEQKEELENLGWYFDNFEIHNVNECLGTYREYVSHSDCFALIDWLNKNHFDYRGLIEKSLAIDATNLEIYK